MQVIELPEAQFEPVSLRFSPDGRLLAAWGWGRTCVLDTATGTVRATLGEKEVGLGSPGVGFTTDARAVVAHRQSSKPQVRVYDIETGAVLRTCPELHGRGLEVGPGGRLVYLTVNWPGPRVAIVRWNPLTGECLPAFGLHKGSLSQLAVSADEKWVAGSFANFVRVWNVGGTKLPTRATRQFDFQRGMRGLVLSADGTFVAYNGPGIGVGEVPTGETWTVSDRSIPWCREVAFHPSRPVLAYSGLSAEVAFYDVRTRTELKRFAWGIEKTTATAFSEDGLRCAAAGRGKVVIWDVDV